MLLIVKLASLILLVAPAESKTEMSGKDIFLRAQKAASQLRSISYDASHLGDGALSKSFPIVDARVVASLDASGQLTRVVMNGTQMMPNAPEPYGFEYVDDGKWLTQIDHGRRTFQRGASKVALKREEQWMFPPYYLQNDAFAAELKASAIIMDEEEKIDGVPCYVLKVSYDARGSKSAIFSIGKDDYLVRRVVTPRYSGKPTINDQDEAAEIFVVRNLVANPRIDDEKFTALKSPPNYRYAPTFPKPSPTANRSTPNGLLGDGSDAPEWTLPDANGNAVSLKSLRGNVVVIDFWASWCGPCKRAMPFLQQLHDKYKSEKVKVFSINCRERGSDAMARKWLEQQGFTYPQLFDGNNAANEYKVRGIPTMYVIGTDGKIIHSERGFSPALLQTMSSIIDKHLESRQAKAGQSKNGEQG